MRRRFIGIAAVIVVLAGLVGITGSQPSTSTVQTAQPTNSATPSGPKQEKITPTCDGKTVTSNCVIDSIEYTTYIYHPAVEEKSHTETVTTYREEIAGYCTLCQDGTYSPSCATGKGACSHHGGVAQWNAPRYTQVPEYSTKKIIDAPAVEAYYEKIIK